MTTLLRFQQTSVAVVALLVTSCLTQSDGDGSAVLRPRVYRGSVPESAASGDEVILDNPLSIASRHVGDEICGYTVYKRRRSDMPFEVILLDRLTGDAKLVVAEGARLDYELKRKYIFDIAAYDCQTGTHADRERVIVEVDDVNEFSPVWTDQLYTAEIDEGSQRNDIIQVAATDADGSPGMSKICQYHVVTPGAPFEVDDLGFVRNTEPLDAHVTDHYSFDVQAEDCGGRVSDDVATVHVRVNPVCRRTGLSGVRDVRVTNGGPHALMPNARLGICDVTCKVERLSVTSRLQTSLIGRGCDRRQLSLREHRKLCGASTDYVNLLPDRTGVDAWTTYLATADDIAGDDPIFTFDGKSTAVEIPGRVIDPDALARSSFTVSMWMKHNDKDHERKQQIVCAADGQDMNRHHYGLFVHKCRLVLLLRRQQSFSSDTPDVLSPAEWRWNLRQVCDGKWHHYVVTAHYAQQIKLHVDGRLHVPVANDPEVLDDFPLRQVHSTRLYVGACWHGAKARPAQYLRGQLADVILTTGTNDSDEAIDCLNRCQEQLQLSDLHDTVNSELSVSMNAAMNEISINGQDVDSVENALRQLTYVNSRLFPTPGPRPLTVETHVKCADGRQPSLDVINVSVDVERSFSVVLLQLAGTTSLARDQQHLRVGDKLFFDLTITASQKKYDQTKHEMKGDSVDDVTDRLRLEPCRVQLEPPMKPEVEHFTYPAELAKSLSLDVIIDESGLTVSGRGSVYDYQSILRQIRYVNTRPETINSRTFALRCFEVGKHVTSNQLDVHVELIKTVPKAAGRPSHVMKEEVKPMLIEKLRVVKSLSSGVNYNDRQAGVGVAVVMVVCVGFIVSLVILGIMRVRNAKRCGAAGEMSSEKQELEWDNSALTVTVNPMHPDNVELSDYDDDDDDDEEEESDEEDCNSDYDYSEAGAPCKLHRTTTGDRTHIL